MNWSPSFEHGSTSFLSVRCELEGWDAFLLLPPRLGVFWLYGWQMSWMCTLTIYVCMVCAMAYLYGTFEFESSLLWNVFCCFMYTTNVFPSTGANDRRMFAKPQTISAQVLESLSGQITDTTLSQPAIHYLAIWLKFYLFSFGWTGRSIIRTKISLGS